MQCRLQFTLLLALVPILGLAQKEDRYSHQPGTEQVIINDSLRYRIEFREYFRNCSEPGEYTGRKNRYFEFDCAERLGSGVRKVRITSGWGIRVVDEEIDSAKGIKYEYTYVSPFWNLENKPKKYFDKLKALTNPSELLEIREVRKILALNQRYHSQTEYYVNDSLLVSRVEIKNNKPRQVDSARYDQGRLVYSKKVLGEIAISTHHYRYDFDSTGTVIVAYDSGDHEKTATKYHQARPHVTVYMKPWGEIEGRTRTTYSGDTLSIVESFSERDSLLGRMIHLRKGSEQKGVKTYSLNGSERYAEYFDEKGRVIKEVWKIWCDGEYTRTYSYFSGR